VRLLIDEAMSQQVARILTEQGHDALHAEDFGLLGAPDTEVMATAGGEQRVLVSVDTDFGELLALGRHPGPSVVLLRKAPHRPEEQAKLLLAVLDEVAPDLEAGAVCRAEPRPGKGPSFTHRGLGTVSIPFGIETGAALEEREGRTCEMLRSSLTGIYSAGSAAWADGDAFGS
jgi:predicted nuclease of predicted toxin-antitoxin system